MKGDQAAVFFTSEKLMLEIVGLAPDGVFRVLSSTCLDPNRQGGAYLPTVAKGYLV